jgi:hypothetical protein
MQCVRFAGWAKLLELDPVRIVLLVLLRGIIAVLALGAGQSNSDSQPGHLLTPIASEIKKDSILKYACRHCTLL